MKKANLDSRPGYIVLVDEQGNVLESHLWDCDYLRQWAKEHGYEMALGNQIDITPFPEEF